MLEQKLAAARKKMFFQTQANGSLLMTTGGLHIISKKFQEFS